jgi:hypothetical protein
MRLRGGAIALVFLPVFSLLPGCHSYQIDVGVENRSGQAIDLVEIDYPSASFGVDTLAAGAEFHYHFKVRGSGPLTVQYTDRATRQVRQISGPSLYERQEGRLEIVLLPGGKAEFHPALSPQP